MTRFSFAPLAALCLLILAACEREAAAPEEAAGPEPWPPARYVLFVMIDTLRADRLGLHGSELGLTPNLDAMADHAYVFERGYPTSPWTRSSVGSMITGRYASSHTALGREDSLPVEALTLAEFIESAGESWTFGIETNGNAGTEVGFAQGYDLFAQPPDLSRRLRYPGDHIELHPADAVSEFALALLERPEAQAAERVFGFIHYIDPHGPYFLHDGMTAPGPEPEGRFDGSRDSLRDARMTPVDEITAGDIARLEWRYNGEVRFVDHWLGWLFDQLRERGIYDQALIVVTSDHGEAFWEHGFQGHGRYLYEEELHVPLIVKYPGMQPGDGRRIEQAVTQVDLAPTIAENLDLPMPDVFEGESLWGWVTGERWLDEEVYAEQRLLPHYHAAGLVEGDLKFLTHLRQRMGEEEWRRHHEMFDLAADPGETDNLVRDQALLDERRRFTRRLAMWESAMGTVRLAGEHKGLDELSEETLEQLKGLGYIQ